MNAGVFVGVLAWVLTGLLTAFLAVLTVGCSVKHHGRTWEIKRFMVDSKNQTIAEIESRDNGEIILRRTMVPVEELEVVEE